MPLRLLHLLSSPRLPQRPSLSPMGLIPSLLSLLVALMR
jgi:hypothetical protein